MRFIPDIRTLTVTDAETGAVTQCTDVMHMARVRRDLELAHRPAAVTSPKKARRLNLIQEAKQGGQR